MIHPMQIGVIISTYNKPKELELVLQGWANQHDKNCIIYVADDGSSHETAAMIERLIKSNYPLPLHHVWQKDDGFRLSRIRNLAIAAATSCDYLIITDGDCIPLPDMIAAHRHHASRGHFLNGGRLLLSEPFTHQLLSHPWELAKESTVTLLKRCMRGEINRMFPLLLPIMTTKPNQKLVGLRGCHLSFWRDDLIKTNGFDEIYHGWGREDSDIAARLFHSGVLRKDLKGIPLLHIWHYEANRSSLHHNDALLSECLKEKRQKARIGIDALTHV
ncbi:MAG: glycosyltransferase family 2 protein [Zetaproteobacteria bacterium]|nr:glycosyltransferase family 2 protein [Zetaproteobacteria bacterium]